MLLWKRLSGWLWPEGENEQTPPTHVHEVKQVKFHNGNKTAKLLLVDKIQNARTEEENSDKTEGKQKQKDLSSSLLGDSNETPDFINKLLSDEFLGKEPPKVLISVTGASHQHYKMNEDLKQVFCLGLINAAKSTTAWIVSGGIDSGVVQYVGNAKQKSITNVPTIGFATFNKLRNQEQFTAEDSIIEYDPTPKENEGEDFVNLNANHTHFVLVKSQLDKFGEEIIIRSNFEDYMHQHHKVPVCLVVVNGGYGTLKTVAAAVVRNFAILIIEGTGRMADAIARELRKGRNQPYEHLETMELDAKQQGYMNMIVARQRGNYPTLYSVADSERFDLQILEAICTNAADGLKQKLKLAVEWNSGELVNYLLETEKSKIATTKPADYLVALNATLGHAIYLDRPEILRILIEKGAKISSVDLRVLYTRQKDTHKFIRDSEIERYYPFCKTFSNFMKHSKAMHVAPLETFFNEDEIKFIQDIFMAANPVFSTYINSLATKLYSGKSHRGNKYPKHFSASEDPAVGTSSASVRINGGEVSLKPLHEAVSQGTMSKFEKVRYMDVMLWAILTGKVELAKVCWEKTRQPVKSSLVAAGLCRNVAKWMVNEHEIYLKTAEWFEAVAVDLLEKVKYDDVKMILTHQPPDFGYSTVEIAVKTESKNFVANRHVQRYMDECLYTDKHGSILPGTNMFQVIMCIILPFLQHLVYTKSDYTRYRGVYKPIEHHRGKWYHFYVLPYTKFWTNTICYLGYLALLAYVLTNQCPSGICFWEFMLWLWMLGYALEEAHQLKAEKWQYFRYFSNRMDILILMLQACYLSLSISGYVTSNQQHTYMALIILIVTTIISYVRLLDVFTINSELGPLYFVLLKIFWDVLKWLLVFVLFALSFQVSFMALDPGSGHEMGSLYIILGNYQDTIGEMSTGFGHALVSVYALIANIMLINLLIAMMGDTFTKVRENADKEWKFARYDLITNYRATSFHPPPFNLIVYPCKRLLRSFKALTSSREIKQLPKEPEQLKNLMKYVRNSYIEAKKSENAGDKMMETLQTMNTKLDKLLPKESKTSEIDESKIWSPITHAGIASPPTQSTTQEKAQLSLAQIVQEAQAQHAQQALEQQKQASISFYITSIGRTVPVTWTGIVNRKDVKRVLLEYKPLRDWADSMSKPDMVQVAEIQIQEISWLGSNKNKVGFVRLKVDIADGAHNASRLVFVRESTIGVLLVLKLSDGAENGKEFTILTTQPRLYGVEFAEIPAGVLEGNQLTLFAANELFQHTGIDVRQEHLTALTKQNVQQGIHFCAGNYNEVIQLFYYRKYVSVEQLNGICKLARDTNTNRIGLKVIPLDDVWGETPDAKTIAALYFYKKLEGKIKP